MKRLLNIAYSVNINLSIGLVLKALLVSSRKYIPNTVLSKVRNLRKIRNSGAKFSNFSLRLPSEMVIII